MKISLKKGVDLLRRLARRFRKPLMFVFLAAFGYLGEVCLMPYLRFGGVSPNLLYVMIGIVTVAYGKLRAFWLGIIFGLLMQIMLPSVTYLNLALYTLPTLFCSFAFADKALKTLESERVSNTKKNQLNPWARTVLCAALNTFIYEVVNITYIYLGGSPLTVDHFVRGGLSVLWTALLCALLMVPLRRCILGPSQHRYRLKPTVLFSRG